MNTGKQEKTLAIVKPDGVQRGLVGEILKRYEQVGLKLVGLKITIPTIELVEKHYLVDPDWKTKVGEKTIKSYQAKGLVPPESDPAKVGENVMSILKKYLTSGPVIAMVWQGMNAAAIVKKITGATEPLTSDVGTIRSDFTIDSYAVADADVRAVRNLVHISSNASDAEKEIPLWFRPEELIEYRLINESILYDVNLDGILE